MEGPEELSKVSLRVPAVKSHTLEFAPEGWFSVRDYLNYRWEKLDVRFVGEGKLLETIEEVAPSEKALSMRLLRYHRQGLMEKTREGHRFLYRVTEKGRRRGLFLEKRKESIYERLPYGRPRGKRTETPRPPT